MLGHRDGIVHDLEALEELPMFFGVLDVEELLRHRHEERLAGAARAREEGHVSMAAEKIAIKKRSRVRAPLGSVFRWLQW